MKCLMISNVFPPRVIGGYELGAFDCAQRLAGLGHDVNVLTSGYLRDESGILTNLNVEWTLDCRLAPDASFRLTEPLHTAERGYLNAANIRTVAGALRRLAPDVVVLWNIIGLGALGLMDFLQSSAIPLVVYLMDDVFHTVDRASRFYQLYLQILGPPQFRPSTAVIAMSRRLCNEVAGHLDSRPENVTYIPGWTHLFVPEPLAASPGAAPRFVVCSRLAPHKGVDIVVEAAGELLRRGETRFSIDVYGTGQVSAFLHLVQARGVSQHIRYAGWKPKSEILALFPNYDALLFPSSPREPFGFVVSEAAGAGCFPIMTTGIGAGEWFVDGVDCWKIARTPTALAEAMHQMISLPETDRRRLRRNALATARRYLSFDRWFPKFEFVLRQAARSRVSRASPLELSRIEASFLYLSQLWYERLDA